MDQFQMVNHQWLPRQWPTNHPATMSASTLTVSPHYTGMMPYMQSGPISMIRFPIWRVATINAGMMGLTETSNGKELAR